MLSLLVLAIFNASVNIKLRHWTEQVALLTHTLDELSYPAIEVLQAEIENKQLRTLRFFNQWKAVAAVNICINKVSRNEEDYYFFGSAISMDAVNKFLLTWNQSAFFSELIVENISPHKQGIEFSLHAR